MSRRRGSSTMIDLASHVSLLRHFRSFQPRLDVVSKMAVPKSSPRDAQVMAAILKDMGVQDYEPRCVNQMLEFAYRYVTDVLDDSKVYSSHANKKNIDGDDVRLAIQCRMDHSFTTPPPRDLLMEIVRNKNSQPLPLIKAYSGPRLPPDRYCLTAPNYKLKSTKKHKLPLVNQYSSSSIPSQRISLTPLQQNISVSSKIGSGIGLSGSNNPTLTVVTKGVSLPTVTIVSKPVSTPSPAITPKPTIRITTGSKMSSTNISSGTSLPITQTVNVSTSSTLPGTVGASTNSITSSSSTSLSSSSSSSGTISSVPQLPPPPPPPPPPQNVNQMSSSSGTTQIATTAQSTTGGVQTNPLKRKLPDDDYDQP